MRPQTTGNLRLIQYLRGAAATMVAVYHASHYLAAARGGTVFAGAPRLGEYGVAIFFAISGSLMAMLVRRSDPWTFLAHRVVRIYPALLIAVAIYLGTYRALGLAAGLDPIGASLVPAGPRFYPLGIEWTLLYEATFYVALFVLAIGRGTDRLEVIALAWLAAIAVRLVVMADWPEELTPPIHRLPLMGVCTGFAAGLLIPAALRRGLVPRGTWVVGAGLVLVSTVTEVGAQPWWAGFASAVLVAGVMRVDEPSRSNRFDPLEGLGDASYGIYLIHVPVLRLVFELAPAGVPSPVVWACGLAGALAAGAMLGVVDVRLYRFLKRNVDRAPSGRLRGVIAVYVAGFGLIACYGVADTAAKEDRAAQERAVLSRLPPGSLTGPDAARAGLEAIGWSRTPLSGAIDAVRPGAGLLLLSGLVNELGGAPRDLSIVVFHRGVQVGASRATRAATGFAKILGRVPAPTGGDLPFRVGIGGVRCEDAGALVVLALDLSGRTGAVLSGPSVPPKC